MGQSNEKRPIPYTMQENVESGECLVWAMLFSGQGYLFHVTMAGVTRRQTLDWLREVLDDIGYYDQKLQEVESLHDISPSAWDPGTERHSIGRVVEHSPTTTVDDRARHEAHTSPHARSDGDSPRSSEQEA